MGYKRINKRTGQEIEMENIVKGVKYDEDQYVIISPEEIAAAYPKTTQSIEIERFIDAAELPFVFLDRPYYVAPLPKAEKVYILLREILAETGKIAIAKVVISTKQHLAALVPSGPGLVLNLLRWGDEVKPLDTLELPAMGHKDIKPSEMKIAKELVEEMTGKWVPEDFENEFHQQIMQIVERKAKAGDTATVGEPEEKESENADVFDLTALLKRSLHEILNAETQTALKSAAKSSASAHAKRGKTVIKK
ncbi:MAG: Ku protein [Comamonas sp.]